MKVLVCLLALGGLLIGSLGADSYMAWVDTDGLMVREKPARSAKAIGKLAMDDVVTVVETTDVVETIEGMNAPWVRIESDLYKGYVFSAYLGKGQEYDPSTSPIRPGFTLRFRSDSEDYKTYGDKKMRETYPQLLSRNGSALNVVLRNGTRMQLVDSGGNDIGVKKYFAVDLLMDSLLLVYVAQWEGYDGFLLNLANGERLQVPSFTYWSNKDMVIFYSTADEYCNPGFLLLDKAMRVGYRTSDNVFKIQVIDDKTVQMFCNMSPFDNRFYTTRVIGLENGKWGVKKPLRLYQPPR